MLHVFGVRHHGPGCARSLLLALEELKPDCIVLEAPADIESVFHLAGSEEMQPPVAMLVYPTAAPQQSVIYPLALFSPEWQALKWAALHQCPVRAMDLPMSHRLAIDSQRAASEQEKSATDAEQTDDDQQEVTSSSQPVPQTPRWRTDPIAILAEAAGYTDHELWWEEQVERRSDATGLFEAILEAMRAVRDEFPEVSEADLLRESWMRKTIRTVLKEGFQNIAVICGAWHSPVLDQLAIDGKRPECRSVLDNARLKGLPRIKTTATWIPWTHSRLSYRSGYGAGVHAPGWYAHLWESGQEAPLRWLIQATRLLRERGLEPSSASVIEAVRLADALAALRELRAPGLQELNEAILSILCHGETPPLEMIRHSLEIGDRLGAVPSTTLSVPLAEDIQRLQKSLRLKPTTATRLIDLDLRNDHAREQSRFIHRLHVLGINWGVQQADAGSQSTFHEIWKLTWEPEFAISIIEANVWGNTLEAAAGARLLNRAGKSASLSELTQLLDEAILSQLNLILPELMQRLQSLSTVATDIVELMNALLPLARIVRYGDVRGTEARQLEPILEGMLTRICVGMKNACSSVDDDLAEKIIVGLQSAQQAVSLLQRNELNDQLLSRIQLLARSELHGLIRGWATRNLLEQNLLDGNELEQLTRVALSPATETAQAASWINGLLRGSGLMLVHQEIVWQVMDHWLAGLPEETFLALLPLLRRSFSQFSHAERRQMGDRVKSFSSGPEIERSGNSTIAATVEADRAARVLPLLRKIIEVSNE